MDVANQTFQEVQKYDLEDFKKAGMDGVNSAKMQYEALKTRKDVRGALSAVSLQIQQVLPDKSQAEIDGYVEIGFLTICSLVVFFIFYFIMQLFCSCFCRRRSKIEPTESKTPAPSTKAEKKSDKKSSTPKKQKSSKKSKRQK